jgi:hypothetical protein
VTGVVSAGGLGRVTKLYGRWGEVEEAEKEEVAEIGVDRGFEAAGGRTFGAGHTAKGVE